MKHLLLLLLFPFFFLAAHSQNLVPNPSFEEYYICPDGGDQVDRAVGWFAARETPEYFNSCTSSPFVSVPNSAVWGHQSPATGAGFCGFQTYVQPDFREAIGCQLNSSLEIGVSYYVSFKLSCAFGGSTFMRCATNNVGIRFSNNEYSFSLPVPIDNLSHVISQEIVSDTTSWVEVSGWFTADSAYSYLYAGNFFDDINTDTLWMVADAGCRAAYYIEDVCVSEDSARCDFTNAINLLGQEDFGIYPNPFDEEFTIQLPEPVNVVRIYNMRGVEISSFSMNVIDPKKVRLDASALEAAAYVVSINSQYNKIILKSSNP